MAFMSSTISAHKDLFLVSDDLEDAFLMPHLALPVGQYDEDEDHGDLQGQVDCYLSEYNLSEFEVVEKFWGQLSAPGYMDRTDFVLGDSQAEVAQQLLDLYFEGRDPDYMDEVEREDMAWLESIAQGEEP